jgi:hypothetical protein
MKTNIIEGLIVLLTFNGCLCRPSDTVIYSRPFLIDEKGVEFNLEQPLRRQCNSASVLVELAQPWKPSPPWTSIQLGNGRLATVRVALFSEDGQTFISSILGSAGGLNARFEPEIPKEASITKVRITSDVPLTCNRVVWHDFNAK